MESSRRITEYPLEFGVTTQHGKSFDIRPVENGFIINYDRRYDRQTVGAIYVARDSAELSKIVKTLADGKVPA